MTQAIQVKYLSATNTKNARVKATCYGGSITVPLSPDDEDLSDEAARAACALANKLGWRNRDWQPSDFIAGVLPNGDDVFIPR